MKQNKQKNYFDFRIGFLVLLFFAFIIVVVLASSVFVVKDIEIVFVDNEITKFSNKKMLSNICMADEGKSIFSVNEDNVEKKIEDSLPEIEVVSIEKKFPSKVYMTLRVREAVYSAEMNNKIVLFDSDFFVITDMDKETFEKNKEKYQVCHIGKILDGEKYKIGQIFNSLQKSKIECLKNIDENFKKNENNSLNICNLADKLIISQNVFANTKEKDKIKIVTKKGVEIFINYNQICEETDKILFWLECTYFNKKFEFRQKQGFVECYLNGSNLVCAWFSKS